MTEALKVSSFGAVADGMTDGAKQLNYAFAVASAEKRPIRFGAGVWAYADILSAVGVQIESDPGAVLYALNPSRSALFLGGLGATVNGLTFSGNKPPAREHTRESCRIVAMGADGFAIRSCVIATCAGAGIRADRSSNGRISKNRLSGTLADSIHITDRSSGIDIEDNAITKSGDDGIAVVSYRDNGAMCHDISARRNRVTDNVSGRCMSVVGGSAVLYEDNFLSGNANAAGLYLAQENAYQTYGVHGVIARHNTLANCGNAKNGHFAVMLFSDGAEANDGVMLSRLHIQNGALGGIRIFGAGSKFAIEQNAISASPQYQVGAWVPVPYSDGVVGMREGPRP